MFGKYYLRCLGNTIVGGMARKFPSCIGALSKKRGKQLRSRLHISAPAQSVETCNQRCLVFCNCYCNCNCNRCIGTQSLTMKEGAMSGHWLRHDFSPSISLFQNKAMMSFIIFWEGSSGLQWSVAFITIINREAISERTASPCHFECHIFLYFVFSFVFESNICDHIFKSKSN